MHLSLDTLLRMTPEQALFRVRNASRVPAAVCRGLAGHVFALRMSDPGLMVRWGRVADAAAERTADLVTAGLSRAHFGNSLRVTGDFVGAAAVLDRAEQFLPTAHPLIHEFRASLLHCLSDFTGAMQELRKAHELRTASGDKIGTAKVLLKAGMVYDFLKQHGEAAGLIEQAIDLLTRCGPEGKEFLLIALQNLGDCLISDGQFRKARTLLDEIEEASMSSGQNFAVKFTWLRGRLSSYTGKDGEACRLYKSARDGYREMDMRQEVALVTLDLALQHHQYSRYATAIREALTVKPILSCLGLENDARVADLLAQIADRKRDMERALLTLSSVIAGARQKRPSS
jgi:tetratricopeptide (TPR) repeat protein